MNTLMPALLLVTISIQAKPEIITLETPDSAAVFLDKLAIDQAMDIEKLILQATKGKADSRAFRKISAQLLKRNGEIACYEAVIVRDITKDRYSRWIITVERPHVGEKPLIGRGNLINVPELEKDRTFVIYIPRSKTLEIGETVYLRYWWEYSGPGLREPIRQNSRGSKDGQLTLRSRDAVMGYGVHLIQNVQHAFLKPE